MSETTEDNTAEDKKSKVDPEIRSVLSQACSSTVLIPVFIVYRFAIWWLRQSFKNRSVNLISDPGVFWSRVCSFWADANPEHSVGEGYGLLLSIVALVVATVLVLFPFSGGVQEWHDGTKQKIGHIVRGLCVGCIFFVAFIFMELAKPFGILIALIVVFAVTCLMLFLDEYVLGELRRRQVVSSQERQIDKLVKIAEGIRHSEEEEEKRKLKFLTHPVPTMFLFCMFCNFVSFFLYWGWIGLEQLGPLKFPGFEPIKAVIQVVFGVMWSFFVFWIRYTRLLTEKRPVSALSCKGQRIFS